MNTHQVFNQTPPLSGINLYKSDHLLQVILARHDTSWGIQEIQQYGQLMGQEDWMQKGALANQYTPVFHSHDRFGFRMDEVEFHPAYHELMGLAIRHRLHALPWVDQRTGSQLVRMAMYYLHAQNEAGTGCPLTMTFSCLPAIKHHLPQADDWLPKITSKVYDPANKPYSEKEGLTIGMAMTEKQGGTDVRANTTRAIPIGKTGPGEGYELTGHKWFCSAPMCDAFLTLAQTDAGLSCFLFPRWRPDGTKNQFRIQRLKNKLGNRSNASSEIEFEGAFAWLMGEEGQGIPTIIEMVALTRYDCMIGSSALMRRALTEVIHHISHRKVMGKFLIDQPLMQNVVADLCLEAEASLAMTYRAALCLENPELETEQDLLRLLTPIGKYWITKRASPFLVEAMECLGGNGYVEDSILPRLYREAPVNAIWEGSGNVQCLDVLRAILKSPQAIHVFIDELESAKGFSPVYDHYLVTLKKSILVQNSTSGFARRLTEYLAKIMQAAQMIKLGNETMADAFCQARLGSDHGLLFGNIGPEVDSKAIISRFL